MKKNLLTFVILVLILVFSSCSKKEGEIENKKGSTIVKDEKADIYGTYWLYERLGGLFLNYR